MEKDIFKKLEEKGEFINMSYFEARFFFIIRKDKYDKIKQDCAEENWTGYDETAVKEKKNRKGYPYRKGRK